LTSPPVVEKRPAGMTGKWSYSRFHYVFESRMFLIRGLHEAFEMIVSCFVYFVVLAVVSTGIDLYCDSFGKPGERKHSQSGVLTVRQGTFCVRMYLL
jgi:hypothetical protein